MPFYKDSMSFGNLCIVFEVEMPKKNELKPEQIAALKNVLPGPKHKPLEQNEKFEYLDDYDATETNNNEEGGKSNFFVFLRETWGNFYRTRRRRG